MKKNIVITAGGTSEPIDNVRKITNSSTGKLGATIANELINNHDDIENIFYICTKKSIKPEHDLIKIIEIESTNDLLNAVTEILTTKNIDYFIHSMAVSDYTTSYVSTAKLLAKNIEVNKNISIEESIINNQYTLNGPKISSNEDNLIIMLKPTPKIISKIKELSPKTYLVGFKLLDNVSTDELITVAKKLRDKNKCDLVVANDLANIKKGNHLAYIIDKEDDIITTSGKSSIASSLVRKMFND